MTLGRHNGPDWDFEWDDNIGAFIYHTKKNVYRIFFGDMETNPNPVCIVRLIKKPCWKRCTKQVRAKEIRYLGSKIVFYN